MFEQHCSEAGILAPKDASKVNAMKEGLAPHLRKGLAYRSGISNTDYDSFVVGVREMANELEKLPEFAMATGSDKEFYQRNDFWWPPHTQTIQAQVAPNHPTQYRSQPYPYGHNITPVDQEGDVQKGGINALQAQMQSLLAAFNSTQGKGDSKNKEYKIDNRSFPPDLSQPESNRRVEQGQCERCGRSPSHRWSERRYRNFRINPTPRGSGRFRNSAVNAASINSNLPNENSFRSDSGNE
ncbi:hypothetical protein K3495_g10091 [Podosphaera aphanis]|nr:hypothetical protein K3495_g10091 [Podosphaera aphanis]